MKNFKYCQNCDRLNIELGVCNRIDAWNTSLWDLCALMEPRMCPWGCNVLLRSWKSLMSMYNKADMICNSVLVLCQSQWDSVCTRLLLLMVDAKFLGSWKKWILANISASGVECHWSRVLRCVDYLHVMCLSSCFHKKVWNSLCKEFLMFVTEGSLPWRFCIAQYEDSFPWRLKCCWNLIWGSWNDWIRLCLREFTARGPVMSLVWV